MHSIEKAVEEAESVKYLCIICDEFVGYVEFMLKLTRYSNVSPSFNLQRIHKIRHIGVATSRLRKESGRVHGEKNIKKEVESFELQRCIA